jgi:hypothetical protein
MKKVLWLVLSLLAASAFADTLWFNEPARAHQWWRPSVANIEGQNYFDPSDAALSAAGWETATVPCPAMDAAIDWELSPPVRCLAQEELDGRAANEAAIRSNAEHQASLPTVYSNGVGVSRIVWVTYSNGWGWAEELVDAGSTNEPPDRIDYLFHASPVHWARANANRSAALSNLVVRRAAKAAGKAGIGGHLQTRIENLERAQGWRK